MSVCRLLPLLLAGVMCTGCFQIRETIHLNEDGSGTAHVMVAFPQLALRYLPGKPIDDWIRSHLPRGVRLTAFKNTQSKTKIAVQEGKNQELVTEVYDVDLSFDQVSALNEIRVGPNVPTNVPTNVQNANATSSGATSALGPFQRLTFTQEGNLLRFRRVVQTARSSDDIVKWPSGPGGPTKAAIDLRTIAALINAGFPPRVYYVSQGGFDSHFGQKNAHPNLMAEWSQAVKAFHDDLVRLNQDHRVLLLTFSEFGRRVKENLSQGTDQGVAGPVFAYGTPVAGGVLGDHPSLIDLDEGDLKSAIDFREIARDWLGVEPAKIVGDEFRPISLLG